MTVSQHITDENYAAKLRELVDIEGKIMDMHWRGEHMTADQMDYYQQLRDGILEYRREHVKRIF